MMKIIIIPFSVDDDFDIITGTTIPRVRITPHIKASNDHLCCFNPINVSLAVTCSLVALTALVVI